MGEFDALNATGFAHRFPPHFHETYAIGVVESGYTRLHTPRGDWIGGPGSILAFAPNEVHQADPVSATGWNYRMIYPSASLFRAFGIRGVDGTLALFRAPVIADAELASAFLRLHHPLMSGDRDDATQDLLVGVLTALVRKHGAPSSTAARQMEERATVLRAQAVMRQRLSETIRLGDLAEECEMSAFHFVRVFHHAVGVPPHAYLIQLRVLRAQTLLAEGENVSHVAHACGFSDQSHLTRTFKKMVGIPPGQYLRSVRPRAA